VAVLVLDLDHFREVNDRLGPSGGDGVLRAAADALRSILPPETSAARFGGDSFGVCLPVLDVQQARQVAEGALAGLRSRVTPEGGRRIPVTGSCGVALFPDHAGEPEELLALAQVAMYAAKEQGRDRVCVAVPDPGWRDRYRTPVERLGLMRQALADGRVLVYAQPVLDLRTGRVSGYELLARLANHEGGVLEPSAFLELAERHGLAPEVDLRVCQKARELVASTPDLRFHVNLSAGALSDQQTLARLLRVGEELGAAAHRVVLEVMERMALTDLEKVLPAVDALRARGFQIALEDFGTGVSSLYLLRRLPVDFVKVDRSFVPKPGRGRARPGHRPQRGRAVPYPETLCGGRGGGDGGGPGTAPRPGSGLRAGIPHRAAGSPGGGAGPRDVMIAGPDLLHPAAGATCASSQSATPAIRCSGPSWAPRGRRARPSEKARSQPDCRPRVAMTRIPVRSAASRAEGCTTNPNRVPTGVPGSWGASLRTRRARASTSRP